MKKKCIPDGMLNPNLYYMSCVTGKSVFGFLTRTDTNQAFNSTKEDG